LSTNAVSSGAATRSGLMAEESAAQQTDAGGPRWYWPVGESYEMIRAASRDKTPESNLTSTVEMPWAPGRIAHAVLVNVHSTHVDRGSGGLPVPSASPAGPSPA
jgi:hypothetical protein